MRILRAGGLATIQDLGWTGYRALGLPPGGAVDRNALRIANALAGAADDAAGIEIALGEVEVEFTDHRTFAATGAVGTLRLDDGEVAPENPVAARPGQRLRITPGRAGRFAYLSVAGGIEVPRSLGSRSTYLPSGLGGFKGRRLAGGDHLPLGAPRPAGTVTPAAPATCPDPAIRITPGPQEHLFGPEAFELLTSTEYRLSPVSDRMGSRLVGAPLPARQTATLPSESTALGAIQIPDDGQPIVMLPDGPTVGGYLKIGVVASVDLGRFGQIPLGGAVRFTWISVAEAQQAWRAAEISFERRLSAIRGANPG